MPRLAISLQKTVRKFRNDRSTRKRGAVAWSAVVTTSFLAFVIGCGGSGSSGPTAPTGNAAVKSMSIASYQSLGAGVAFPFAGLVASSPPGSSIHTLALLSPRFQKYVVHPHAQTLQFVSELNLYTDGGVKNGGKDVFHYFTDSAGTHSAGSMTLSSGGGTFEYTSYPATIGLTVDVTAGNLPCHGTATIVFNGDSGTNTLKGALTLTKNSEEVTVDLTLSPSLQVGGTMSIKEDETTIEATNVTGPVTGDLTLDFTLQPQGYTGTGKINLNTSSIDLTFTNPTGASCKLDSSGNLVLHFPGGTSETIHNPFSAPLSGGGGTGTTSTATTSTATTSTATTATATTATATTSTATTATATTATATTATASTGGTGFYFETPTPLPNLSGITLAGVSASGQMVGNVVEGSGKTSPYLFATQTAAKTTLKFSGYQASAAAVNSKGVVAGSMSNGAFSNSPGVAAVWLKPTTAATALAGPAGYGYSEAKSINASGEIVGDAWNFTQFGRVSVPVYWKDYKSQPKLLAQGTYSQYLVSASNIDDAGHILSISLNSGFVWSNSTAQPVLLTVGGIDANAEPLAMSNYGIVGYLDTGGGFVATRWNAPAFGKKDLSKIADGSFVAVAINNKGEAGGQTDKFHACVWPVTGAPTDVNTTIPKTPPFTDTLARVTFVFDDGSIIATSQTKIYYLKSRAAPNASPRP